MTIYKIYPKGFAANGYLLTAEGHHEAVAIDPATPRLLEEAQKRGLFVRYALLTHGHFDHICGCAALEAAGARIGCLCGEEPTVRRFNLGVEMGGVQVPAFTLDFTFRDGEEFVLCGIRFRAIATPGHTAGSCCFLASEGGKEALFTGDTLFAGDVGRTDLPTGSAAAMEESLNKLAALPYGGAVCPGHGEDSTLAEERETNPYFGKRRGTC